MHQSGINILAQITFCECFLNVPTVSSVTSLSKRHETIPSVRPVSTWICRTYMEHTNTCKYKVNKNVSFRPAGLQRRQQGTSIKSGIWIISPQTLNTGAGDYYNYNIFTICLSVQHQTIRTWKQIRNVSCCPRPKALHAAEHDSDEPPTTCCRPLHPQCVCLFVFVYRWF